MMSSSEAVNELMEVAAKVLLQLCHLLRTFKSIATEHIICADKLALAPIFKKFFIQNMRFNFTSLD